MKSQVHDGDPVYLYEADARPIGKVRAVRGDDLIMDLANGEEFEVSLECVESAADRRVLLAAHRIDPEGRESLERARTAAAAAGAPGR
jgi:hypothetical protein